MLDEQAALTSQAEDFVRGLASNSLAPQVGEVHEYSIANCITLGMIVQAVSGIPC
jgi:hypothetical protein